MSVLAMPSSYEQPRKGVNTDGYPIIESSTSWMIMTATTTIWSQVVIPQTVLGASPTNSAIADESDRPRYSGNRQNRDGQMSATAQHLLIAAGAIGKSFIVSDLVYLANYPRCLHHNHTGNILYHPAEKEWCFQLYPTP